MRIEETIKPEEKEKSEKGDIVQFVEMLNCKRVADRISEAKISFTNRLATNQISSKGNKELGWGEENEFLLQSEGVVEENTARYIACNIRGKNIPKAYKDVCGYSGEYSVTLIYPNNEDDFNDQLSAWKKEKGPNQVLFIFSKEKNTWQAYLILNVEKECEVKTVDKNSPFYQHLQSYTSDTYIHGIKRDLNYELYRDLNRDET